MKRYINNPIITKKDVPWPCNVVFNPGACKFEDKFIVLARVEDLDGRSYLLKFESPNGLTQWTADESCIIRPYFLEESWGIEDPRITPCKDGTYMITYTQYSEDGVKVGAMMTRDFKEYFKFGTVLDEDTKDNVYVEGGHLIHRPTGKGITIEHGCDSKVILNKGVGSEWNAARIGIGPPLIPYKDKYIMIYHGVKATVAGDIYRAGVAVLTKDFNIHRASRNWWLSPEMDYERVGDVPNVVFPEGWVERDDGSLIIYYGCADTSIGAVLTTKKELFDFH